VYCVDAELAHRLRTRRAGEPRNAISLRAAEDPSLYQQE
jgi:hypothetical protein